MLETLLLLVTMLMMVGLWSISLYFVSRWFHLDEQSYLTALLTCSIAALFPLSIGILRISGMEVTRNAGVQLIFFIVTYAIFAWAINFFYTLYSPLKSIGYTALTIGLSWLVSMVLLVFMTLVGITALSFGLFG